MEEAISNYSDTDPTTFALLRMFGTMETILTKFQVLGGLVFRRYSGVIRAGPLRFCRVAGKWLYESTGRTMVRVLMAVDGFDQDSEPLGALARLLKGRRR